MLVVDASVTIKWVVPEDGEAEVDTELALALLGEGLLAPDLMLVEFCNAMWKKVRNKEIGALQATDALTILPTIVSVRPGGPYLPRALDIAIEIDHPFYDCVYLAVAKAHRSSLVTADKRLLAKCQSSGIGIPIKALGAT